MDRPLPSKASVLTLLQRRIDPSITEIMFELESAAHYEFDSTANVWHRQGIEGTLYVVKRSTEPFYSIVILNKQGSRDYVQHLSSEMEFEKKDPQIWFYRDGKGVIQGIWSFYEDNLNACFDKILELQKSTAETQTKALKSMLLIAEESPRASQSPKTLPILKPQFHKSGVQLPSSAAESSGMPMTKEQLRTLFLTIANSDALLDAILQRSLARQ
mmetsp:Transcript_23229/g.41350  ORF Transcript_23229/g.41350 Transcript_23229/m.41350 type:complete len:215 (-) Transcript_23229:183-827(-)